MAPGAQCGYPLFYGAAIGVLVAEGVGIGAAVALAYGVAVAINFGELAHGLWWFG